MHKQVNRKYSIPSHVAVEMILMLKLYKYTFTHSSGSIYI